VLYQTVEKLDLISKPRVFSYGQFQMGLSKSDHTSIIKAHDIIAFNCNVFEKDRYCYMDSPKSFSISYSDPTPNMISQVPNTF
jgi:hypothetical protein